MDLSLMFSKLLHFVPKMLGNCNNLEVEIVIYCPESLTASPEAIVSQSKCAVIQVNRAISQYNALDLAES